MVHRRMLSDLLHYFDVQIGNVHLGFGLYSTQSVGSTYISSHEDLPHIHSPAAQLLLFFDPIRISLS